MHDYPLIPALATTSEHAVDGAAVFRAVGTAVFAAATFAAKVAGGIAGAAAGVIAAPLTLIARGAHDSLGVQEPRDESVSVQESKPLQLLHEIPVPHAPMALISQVVRELDG